MYLHLFPIIIMSQQCFGIYINITNEENKSQSHSDKPLKPPDGMMSDQGDPGSSDAWSGYFDSISKYIYGMETTPAPLGDMISSTVASKVLNKDADPTPSHQPESQVDLGSSKELNHLSDNNLQDVIGVIENFTVNRLTSQVDVDIGPLEELNLPSKLTTQDVSEVSKEVIDNQPESQVEVDIVDNQAVAQWVVAAIIFIVIALYVVVFIIAVAILECKGKGRRTTDDEKFGSLVEKEKLLNGAAISEDTKGFQIADEFDNFDKSYTNAALQLESSPPRNYNHSQLLTDRTDLHHLLGSPVAEVEVFPQGSLPRPPKKGCLQY